MPARALAVHVDHLFTGDGPAVRDAAVVARGDGTIVEVGPAADVLPRHEGVEVRRVVGVAFPGLVNAHTHLELSALAGKVPGGRGFVSWVDGLIGIRSEVSPEDDEAAIASAVDELVRSGTVAVGEVTNTLAAVTAMARRGLAGSVFHEVFGVERAAVLRRVEGLRADLEARVPAWPSRELAYAPAPHTLYTTHPDAVRTLLATARARGDVTSIHLAEHDDERLALEEGRGATVEWLKCRTRHAREWPLCPLFDVADELGVLAPSTLLVHLACARPDELERVATRGAEVVLCPRSNLTIEGRLPPLASMREVGLRPALGTDSLASSPSLDVLAEAAVLAAHHPHVPAWELVAMASANGARALRRPELGRIARGTCPGVVAVDGPRSIDDPGVFLFQNLSKPRRFVVPRPTMELLES